MYRLTALCFVLLLSARAVASEQNGQSWLEQADSLRNAGQDAAALDYLQSAEQQFRKVGEDCWVARFAERRARIHLDWRNPQHAAEALSAALVACGGCTELDRESMGWRFALAQSKLDVGARDEARWILAELASEAAWSEDANLRQLAMEANGRLAHMALEEGDFTQASADFVEWASALSDMGQQEQALEALGWSAVSASLSGADHTAHWDGIRDHSDWTPLPLRVRARKALGWAGMLLGAGERETFDALATWPWARALERTPGHVDAELETQWAMMRARRHRKDHVAQALAASHQAELSARFIRDRELRDATLSEALRMRADILAGTGAHGPAYFALHEADSLSLSASREERARDGLFESEPWLSAIGDARTRIETQRMEQWQKVSVALAVTLLLTLVVLGRSLFRMMRIRSRLRHLQQHWLPGRQHQVRELALSGARLAEAAQVHTLPAGLKRELAEFGRLAALCAEEVRHEPVNLKALCLELAESRKAEGPLEWSLQEEVPFRGDADQLLDFLRVLLAGLGKGGCRMAMRSTATGLEVAFDSFTERAWWRQAMTLFAGDGETRHWSLVRLRCDRLGGVLNLDCDAAGAQKLHLDLPVYSA